MQSLILAEEVKPGQCFRKQHGTYVYLAISKASAVFFGLKEDMLYGVCYNGNMIAVALHKKVILMSLFDMNANRKEQDDWM